MPLLFTEHLIPFINAINFIYWKHFQSAAQWKDGVSMLQKKAKSIEFFATHAISLTFRPNAIYLFCCAIWARDMQLVISKEIIISSLEHRWLKRLYFLIPPWSNATTKMHTHTHIMEKVFTFFHAHTTNKRNQLMHFWTYEEFVIRSANRKYVLHNSWTGTKKKLHIAKVKTFIVCVHTTLDIETIFHSVGLGAFGSLVRMMQLPVLQWLFFFFLKKLSKKKAK